MMSFPVIFFPDKMSHLEGGVVGDHYGDVDGG